MSRRLSALERTTTPTATLWVWRGEGETAEQTIARSCPEGVPASARVVIYRWGATDDGKNGQV